MRKIKKYWMFKKKKMDQSPAWKKNAFPCEIISEVFGADGSGPEQSTTDDRRWSLEPGYTI